MIYTQFKDKVANCKNVRIEKKLPEELLADVKNLTKAGNIKIVYLEVFKREVADIERTLQKAGYIVQSIMYDENIFVEELEENSEGIILLGESLAQTFSGKKYIIVAENLNLFDMLHKTYHSIIIYEEKVKLIAFDLIASVYGTLMTKLIACFDFKLACICYNKTDDLQIVEEIESIIIELFSQSYIYYRDEQFFRDLLNAVINVGLLEGMLTNTAVLDGYKMSCKVVQSMAKSKKLLGEYAMLVGWFVVNTIKSLVNIVDCDLFIPNDIMADIDFVAQKINISKADLFKITDKITATEYLRLSFVSSEYSKEIEKYLDKIYPCCVNAMKNYRRIYYDAGLEVASSISLNNLSSGVLRSVTFNPQYSYLKTLRVLGAV